MNKKNFNWMCFPPIRSKQRAVFLSVGTNCGVNNISHIIDVLYIVSSLTQETLTNNNATNELGAGCQKEPFFLPAWIWKKNHAFPGIYLQSRCRQIFRVTLSLAGNCHLSCSRSCKTF